ncbi:MAG: hypothetical protein HIU93_13090 [Acidobacteria bacterium]|nr:hypothetical protein [Acidobacteriota bacterium]MBW4045446.1 hypothetical protein [Acidobacteriota bacterium]
MSDDASAVKPSVRPWIVLVGGFLGAGKTTLILAAARELERLGQRCAVIMNDQGTALVDTRFAGLHGRQSGEVTGGCFCCRLSDLIEVADKLRVYSPHVIFAEPVGSCADIVATVLRPFQEYQHDYRIAPFTVLVDPARAEALLRDDAEPNLGYLFRKQIEEADLVCYTKTDVHPAFPAISCQLPGRPVRQICATTGQGVLAWLDEVLSGSLAVASETLEIDYAQYAQAESSLAWLNLKASFEPTVPVSPAMVLGPFLDSLDQKLTAAGIAIVHLKTVVTSPTAFVKAAICENGQDPWIEGALDASPSAKHDVLLNLRALGQPDQVQNIVEQELSSLDGNIGAVEFTCFSPAAPKPERRIAKLIKC